MRGELLLVGLGICDEKDISLRGLGELKKCQIVFAEGYTNLMRGRTLERLGKKIRGKIILLSREEVEGEQAILQAAKEKRTALLVPGDPLIATTHTSLILSARKAKIPVKIVHSSSILSAAISESGLQAYKFGKTVTLPHWRERYKPTSTYDAIRENKRRGLHTLVLLDVDEKLGPLDAKKALGILLEIEKMKNEKIAAAETEVLVLSRIGYGEQKISPGKTADLLLPGSDLGEPPFVLIFPAKLHFLEEEWLERLRRG